MPDLSVAYVSLTFFNRLLGTTSCISNPKIVVSKCKHRINGHFYQNYKIYWCVKVCDSGLHPILLIDELAHGSCGSRVFSHPDSRISRKVAQYHPIGGSCRPVIQGSASGTRYRFVEQGATRLRAFSYICLCRNGGNNGKVARIQNL